MRTNIKNDMKMAAFFYTKKFPAFNTVAATSNFVESWNAILKRAVEWKRLRFDNLTMVLFNLTIHYLSEFSRCYKSLGNWFPKDQYIRRGPQFKLPPYVLFKEEKLLEKFKTNYAPCVGQSQAECVSGNKL